MEEKKFYALIDNSKEIELSKQCIEECAHSGECGTDCENGWRCPK